MTTDPSKKAKPQGGYHHGDLRRELIKVARQEIACHGSAGITLSALSRLAKVSQGAPYRHFENLSDLFEALAVEGFEEACAAVDCALAQCKPEDELEAVALAFVDYAERNLELYRLMFASRLVPQAKDGSALDIAADRSFEQLRCVVAKTSPPEAVQDDAILIWAQLHGLLMLKADGLIASPLSRFVKLSACLPRSKPAGPPIACDGPPALSSHELPQQARQR
jgi:AcrR family transcriptional regulator